MSPTWRMYVVLPPMLGPVMSKMSLPFSSSVSFGTKFSIRVHGCRPLRMRSTGRAGASGLEARRASTNCGVQPPQLAEYEASDMSASSVATERTAAIHCE